MEFRGLNISIETDKGEYRHWYDVGAKKAGKTKMTYPYGYIRRTKGVDGDHVDCYIGPNVDAPKVYVVHQQKAPDFNTYDEDKCMLGFNSADEAKKAYLANFNNDRFFGSMTILSFEEFKRKALRTMKRPEKIAYDAGSMKAAALFSTKISQEGLGDPNFWGQDPNAQQQEGMAQPAATAEEAIQGLPAGTFQGLQLKITPDGQRNTTVKVTPEATSSPEGIQGIFAAEPGAKVEIAQPEMTEGGEAGGVPGQPSPDELQQLIASKAASYGQFVAIQKIAYGQFNPELPQEFFGAKPGVNPGTTADLGTLRGAAQGVPSAAAPAPGLGHAQTVSAAGTPPGMSTAPAAGPLQTAATKVDLGARVPPKAPALGGKMQGLGKLLQKLGPRGRMLGIGLGGTGAGVALS
jgi:hypothetical protein